MKSIFSYESKFMQVLLVIADIAIANLLFVLCSIPLFTIGAAQAGLYTACRTLANKEDDTPIARSFFQGFRSGFKTITVTWGIFTLLILVMGYTLVMLLIVQQGGWNAPVWINILALVILVIFQSVVTVFHSDFGCTPMQLFRNTFFTMIAHPIKSICVAFFAWLPVIVFFVAMPLFMQGTPVWVAGYYTIAFTINNKLMKKPFEIFTMNFVEKYEAEHGEIKLEEANEAEIQETEN